MFDSIIYRMLDKIVNWCERYKEYKIKRSLPKATYDEKAKKEDLNKWLEHLDKRTLINNIDTDYTGNTKTTNTINKEKYDGL